eukprot:7971999-Alexandrium_andersonii.AAC.1
MTPALDCCGSPHRRGRWMFNLGHQQITSPASPQARTRTRARSQSSQSDINRARPLSYRKTSWASISEPRAHVSVRARRRPAMAPVE